MCHCSEFELEWQAVEELEAKAKLQKKPIPIEVKVH
jgi:hypothetical protein